jgi:hypothetical protein
MRGDDAPSLAKSRPALALVFADGSAFNVPGNSRMMLPKSRPKCNYVESIYGLRQVSSWPGSAKGRDFLITVQIFRSSEAHGVLGIPEDCGLFLIGADLQALLVRE